MIEIDAELEHLLDAIDAAPVHVAALPALIADGPARAFRIDTLDRRRFKGVLAWSAARAETIARVFALGLPALPRLYGHHGRALLCEWIEGDAVDVSAAAEAGAFLAQIHRASPRLPTEPRLTPEACLARVAPSAPDDDASWRAAYERACGLMPRPSEALFVHTDLAPDNLVRTARGLVSIDNGSWAIAPAAYDIARAWWRWPLHGAAWHDFIAAYGPAPLADLPFWQLIVALDATRYRVAGGAPIADARARIEALL